MADGDVGEGRAADQVTCALDAVEKVGGVDTDLVVGVAVQILGADRDADDERGEGRAVLVNGLAEGSQLVLDGLRAARDPEAQQEGCAGVDGGGDGLDNVVGRLPLNCGFLLPC